MDYATAVAKAKVAIKDGRTRGQFIRENSGEGDSKRFLQFLSDAYTDGMKELQRRGK